jgi:hypothetical protein
MANRKKKKKQNKQIKQENDGKVHEDKQGGEKKAEIRLAIDPEQESVAAVQQKVVQEAVADPPKVQSWCQTLTQQARSVQEDALRFFVIVVLLILSLSVLVRGSSEAALVCFLVAIALVFKPRSDLQATPLSNDTP